MISLMDYGRAPFCSAAPHIEILLFEDSEWSRGRYKLECQVEELEHFRL